MHLLLFFPRYSLPQNPRAWIAVASSPSPTRDFRFLLLLLLLLPLAVGTLCVCVCRCLYLVPVAVDPVVSLLFYCLFFLFPPSSLHVCVYDCVVDCVRMVCKHLRCKQDAVRWTAS